MIVISNTYRQVKMKGKWEFSDIRLQPGAVKTNLAPVLVRYNKAVIEVSKLYFQSAKGGCRN